MTGEIGYQGALTPENGFGEFNAQLFLIRQVLAKVNTATLVKVVSVTNNGGVSPVGFVEVQPLVNQLDGNGNAVPHGVVHNLPYFRIQGGANAVIIDPQVGDIGVAVFAQHDISSVKATKAQANPGSFRRFDMADGMYFGGYLNGLPSQYVQFNTSGISVVSPQAVTVQAPQATVTASTSATINTGTATVNATGNVSIIAAGSAVIQAASIALQNAGTALKALLNSAFATWAETHVHSNGNAGANTGAPTTSPPASGQTSTVTAE